MIEKTRSRSKIPKPKKTPWSQKPHKPLAAKRKFNAQDNPTKTYQVKHSQEEVQAYAEECRKERLANPTTAEIECEGLLRTLRCRYEREKIIYYARGTKFIIIDFFIEKGNIAIECDGGIHERQDRYDEGRDTFLKKLGTTTLRFTNQEILVNMPAVLEKIRELMT